MQLKAKPLQVENSETQKMLFDSIERTYFGPARFSEAQFAFLNRSARQTVGRVRDIFEAWFACYPEIARADVRSRFRSEERRQHLGAAFELYCSAILKGQNMEYGSLLQSSGVMKSAPDFHVSSPTGVNFCLEATLVAESDEKVRRDNLMNQLRDELDKTFSPNFFLRLAVDQFPKKAFSASGIRRFLETELGKLNPDEVSDQFENGGSDLPSWEFSEGGGELVFAAIPKKPEARGKMGVRPIGAVSTPAEWVNSRKPVVKALRTKASKYGKLDRPFVIAINCLDLFLDEEEIAESLFGRPLFHPEFFEPLDKNFSKEAFWGACQYTRVSAVLVGYLILPSQMARSTPILWHNPFAARPLPMNVWKGPQVAINWQNRQVERFEGMSGAEMLELDPKWPE